MELLPTSFSVAVLASGPVTKVAQWGGGGCLCYLQLNAPWLSEPIP